MIKPKTYYIIYFKDARRKQLHEITPLAYSKAEILSPCLKI